MKKTNKMIFIGITLFIIFIGITGCTTNNKKSSSVSDKSSSVDTQTSGNVQEATLGVSGSIYTLTPSQFVKGVPVRIKPDMSKLPGCSRAVVIPDFGIRKNIYSASDVIEFTPDKSGTFEFMCSMNMYQGRFTVSDN